MNRIALENGTRIWHNTIAAGSTEVTVINRNKIFSDKKNEILIATSDVVYYTRLLFPTPLNLTHLFIANRVTDLGADTMTGVIYKSNDTTDGFDGTWVTSGVTLTKNNTYDAGAAQTFSHSGVKGLYWTAAGYYGDAVFTQMIAAYGSRAATSLHMIETTTTTPVLGENITYGTVQRGIVDSSSFSFRVRNGGSLQANNVTVSTYMHTEDTLGANVIGLSFSSDGGSTWHNNLSLGNLTAGSNSGIINLKLTTFNDMPVGRYRPRIALNASSWS